jgi:hypothetical protein
MCCHEGKELEEQSHVGHNQMPFVGSDIQETRVSRVSDL